MKHVKFGTINKNGIYRLSIDAYHAQPCIGPSISSSGLRTIFKRSAAHFWCESSLNPDATPKDETDAFRLGRAAHHLLLGEDDFSTLFVERPEKVLGETWHGNKTVCRAWMNQQLAAGRTVVLPSDMATIRGMHRSLKNHPLIKAGILNGEVEQSLIWKDKETGVYCKSRPDCIPNDSGDFADLKSTQDVDYYEISKTIAEYGYHQQAALVAEGYKIITGKTMQSFSLVFVEKKPPHCVRIAVLKDCDLERGAAQNRAALRIFANCLQSGEWPGPAVTDCEFVELPKWAQDRIDDKLLILSGKKKKDKDKSEYTAADYVGAG